MHTIANVSSAFPPHFPHTNTYNEIWRAYLLYSRILASLHVVRRRNNIVDFDVVVVVVIVIVVYADIIKLITYGTHVDTTELYYYYVADSRSFRALLEQYIFRAKMSEIATLKVFLFENAQLDCSHADQLVSVKSNHTETTSLYF